MLLATSTNSCVELTESGWMTKTSHKQDDFVFTLSVSFVASTFESPAGLCKAAMLTIWKFSAQDSTTGPFGLLKLVCVSSTLPLCSQQLEQLKSPSLTRLPRPKPNPGTWCFCRIMASGTGDIRPPWLRWPPDCTPRSHNAWVQEGKWFLAQVRAWWTIVNV